MPLDLVAVDTETFLIHPGCKAPQLVCVSWYDGNNHGVIKHDDPVLFDFFVEIFSNRRSTWMNAPFDLAVILEKFPDIRTALFGALDDGLIHDVMMREKLIDLGRGTFRFEEDEDGNVKLKSYSLGAIASRRKIGKKMYDEWQLRYHELWDVPLSQWPKEALYYAMHDAHLTYDVHQKQARDWRRPRAPAWIEKGLSDIEPVNLHDEASQVAAHFALHLASCWGIRTDAQALDALYESVSLGIESVREKLVDAGLVRPDGRRNTKKAIRRMMKVMQGEAILTKGGLDKLREGMKPAELAKLAWEKGKYVSVSMEACDLSGDEVMRNYSLYTRLRNLLTGSIKHLRKGTILPIQTRFEPLMETGRTSSSGPNIQNLRRAPGVRECFVPRNGMVFVAADYSSAELHTLAQTCLDLFGYSKLAEALNEGRDVHLWVASLILGITYEDAVERKARDDVSVKNARQLAKAANFGFPGGCSARRFVALASGYKDADGNPLDLDELASQKLRSLWFRSWPEMRQFFDHVSDSGDSEGWYWVKQSRTDRIRARTTYTAACNSYFQGLCADGAKRAVYEVTRRQFCDEDSPLWNTALVNFIHDEIIVECPTWKAHEVAIELERVMEDEFNQLVPNVPTRAEAVVMRYWSKKAKRIEKDGRLVPWPEAS